MFGYATKLNQFTNLLPTIKFVILQELVRVTTRDAQVVRNHEKVENH